MNVVLENPGLWFLVESKGRYFLDGYYSMSFAAYSWNIELNNSEIESFQHEGEPFIQELYLQIQKSCPIHKDSNSAFKERALSDEMNNSIHEAIMEYRNLE